MDSAWEAHLASTLASVYTCVGIHTHMSTHDAHHTHMFTRKIKLQRSSWIISLTVTHNLSYTPISFPMEEPNHDPSTNAGTGPRMRVSVVWQWRGILKQSSLPNQLEQPRLSSCYLVWTTQSLQRSIVPLQQFHGLWRPLETCLEEENVFLVHVSLFEK